METDDPIRQDHAGLTGVLAGQGSLRLAAARAVVLVSGGFDPLHIGHVRLIQGASDYGRVYVALNSDAWLVRKKGFAFMPWAERAEILRSLRWVDRVFEIDDSDGTVCQAIKALRPGFFANGGDRTTAENAESFICSYVGTVEIFGVGGGKVQSSSSLVQKAKK